MDESIKQRIIDLVGPENFSDKLIDLVSYSSDASQYKAAPDCAVWPRNTDQVSRIVALANEHKIPVTPRGGGTGLCGLAVAAQGGIILDMIRMNKIVRLSIPDRTVVVQPGVVYADLQAELNSQGFFYPPDPASGAMCTLGGNIGTNAGGLKAAKYGATRDYVLGLEVVLADGSVGRVGGATLKSSSGFDLPRLFVGSEGTLGIVTEITLKISPKPGLRSAALATFDRLDQAARAITEIMHSGVIPSVLEFMDAKTIEMYREHTDLGLPPAEGILLTEVDGHTRAEIDFQLNRILEVFKNCQAISVETADSEAEIDKIWYLRKAIGGLVGQVAPNQAPEDVTVPMSRCRDFVRGCQEIADKYDLNVLNYGHVGDGNFHPNFMYDAKDEDQVRRLKLALHDLHQLACDLGGALTGEHGIGYTKADYMTMEHDPTAMRIMRDIKKALDPNNILNPGKMGL